MKNKEIEELLNRIKQQLITDEKLGKEIAQDFHKTTLNYKEVKLLLSHIEELEAETRESNESVIWWTNRFNAVERYKKQLENNRDKAIEYINNLRDESAERQGFYNCFPDDLYIADIEKLLNILKGDNNGN